MLSTITSIIQRFKFLTVNLQKKRLKAFLYERSSQAKCSAVVSSYPKENLLTFHAYFYVNDTNNTTSCFYTNAISGEFTRVEVMLFPFCAITQTHNT